MISHDIPWYAILSHEIHTPRPGSASPSRQTWAPQTSQEAIVSVGKPLKSTGNQRMLGFLKFHIYICIYICTLYIYIYMYIIYICTLYIYIYVHYIYVYIVKHCWFQNSNHISRISRLWVHEMWDAQKVAGALGFVQLGVRLWSICPQLKVMAGRWPESSSKSGSNSFWEFLSFLSFVVFFWFCLYYVCAFACARTLGKASICNLLHEASMPKWIINHFWLSYSTRT